MPASPQGPVLIVDDDAAAREALGALLEASGYRVAMATGVDDALEGLRAGLAPCIILLDLLLPGKDGFAFRDAQLADPELTAIPVVIYSGYHNVHYSALEM